MADFLEVAEEGVRRLLNANLDIYVIPDYDGNPEPVDNYGTVGIATATPIPMDHNTSSTVDSEFKEINVKAYQVVLDINFYGPSASSYAAEALAVFGSPSQRANLHYSWGLGYVRSSGVRRIPELRETVFLPRFSFDATFTISQESIRTLDWFDTVEYEGIYEDVDGSVVLTQENVVSANDNPEDMT